MKTSGLLARCSAGVADEFSGLLLVYRWRVEVLLEGWTRWKLPGSFLGQCLMEVVFISYSCYHKIPQTGWLRTPDVYCLSSGGRKSEIKVLAVLCTFWKLCGRICSSLPSWLLVAIGVPWLIDGCFQCLFSWCSSHVRVSKFPFLEGRQSY